MTVAVTKSQAGAVFLMGPTATGKTDLAIELSRRLPLEIVSVDSALIYKEMNIGTAKPSPALLAEAPHHLIDFLDPAQSYSAAEFRDDALDVMARIWAKGKIPLFVGGTMLYYRFLLQPAPLLPAADAELRAAIEAEAEQRGWPALHEQLRQVDPEAAARIHPNHSQRIQRALEIYRTTGKTISELWRAQEQLSAEASGTSVLAADQLIQLALLPKDRALLHQRIEQRFDLMLAGGLLDEVAALQARGDLHLDLPSMRAVGYRQVWRHLCGDYDYASMRQQGIAATRQLAKRQLTWLRRWPGLERIYLEDSHLLENTLKKLSSGPIVCV